MSKAPAFALWHAQLAQKRCACAQRLLGNPELRGMLLRVDTFFFLPFWVAVTMLCYPWHGSQGLG